MAVSWPCKSWRNIVIEIGKLLLGLGLALVVIGAVLILAGRTGVLMGRLPGDFVFRSRHATVYFPLVTCLVISVVLTLVIYVISRFR